MCIACVLSDVIALEFSVTYYAGKVVRRHEFSEEGDQFGFLERMNWEMHHRRAVRERRAAWRASATKAKKRYPLAVRRRRRRVSR
jgi:hypothetical protein